MNGCLVMKLLKDEVRQRIIAAAREEFLLSGYRGASMRAIASTAEMTVGNIYLYFAGKERLFDALVGRTMERLRTILAIETDGADALREVAEALGAMIMEGRVEFLLLMTRSDGSKYENIRQMLVEFAQQRLGEAFPSLREGLLPPLSVAIVEGLLNLFINFDGDEETLSSLLFQFLNLMLGGLLTGGHKENACEN